jgi:hypothetical protein
MLPSPQPLLLTVQQTQALVQVLLHGEGITIVPVLTPLSGIVVLVRVFSVELLGK